MRRGGWTIGCLVGSCCLVVISGCVNMDEHMRLKAAHRRGQAEKEGLFQEITDVRVANEALRSRLGSLERELGTKSELLANVRSENELLDEMRRTAQGALEEVASKQVLGSIDITGPKLPPALDSALAGFAEQYPSQVVYDPARGTVKWQADLLFTSGSDVVKESSTAALRGFAEVIKSSAAHGFEVIVVGHTDTQPIKRSKAKHPTNWHLSAHRAIAVAFALQKYGYEPEQLAVMGMGEYRPVGDNASKAGAAANRRVEIYLVPENQLVQTSAGPGWRVNGRTLAYVPLSRERTTTP